MSDGWRESADAWIRSVGDRGDWGREFVLDAPMIARVVDRAFRSAADIGCGEGRFCRILHKLGIPTTGIDPTQALIDRARLLDPAGDYRIGRAENLELPDASFDLVVSYLSLIDIPDLAPALAEMARILRPGGTLLIANLQSFNTAGGGDVGKPDADGKWRFGIDHYLDERVQWLSWAGIRIQNWHRPLGTYMSLLLEQGLTLRHFAEPSPVGADPDKAALYRRAPWFLIMEWRKPAP